MNLTGRPVFLKGIKKRRRASALEKLDVQFLEWLRKQPCCICSDFREYVHGIGRSQAAHVRLGGRGAVADKPLFSAVPLCNDDHGLQHQAGHEAHGSKEVWLNLADAYLYRWQRMTGVKLPTSDSR